MIPNLNNKTVTKVVLVLICLLLSFHAAFRGSVADYDAQAYISFFENLRNVTHKEFISNLMGGGFYYRSSMFQIYEVGFAILTYLIASFTKNYATYFFIVALIAISLKFIAIYKLSSKPFYSLLWYICFFYMILDMTAIRAGLAAGVLMYSISYLINKNYIKFTLLVILASTFHVSALFFLSLIVVSEIKYNKFLITYIILGCILLSFIINVDILRYFAFLNEKIRLYFELLERTGQFSEVNKFNVIILIRVCLLLCCLYFARNINKFEQKYLQYYAYSICIFYLLSFLPVLGVRLYELVGILQVFGIVVLFKIRINRLIKNMVFFTACFIHFFILVYWVKLVDFFYFWGVPYNLNYLDVIK